MKKQDPNHKMISSSWNKCHPAPTMSATSTYDQKPAFCMCTTSCKRRSHSKQVDLIPPLVSKLIKYWKAHGPIFLHFWRSFFKKEEGRQCINMSNLKFYRIVEGWHLKESKRVKSHYSEVTLKYEVIHSWFMTPVARAFWNSPQVAHPCFL